MSNDSPREFKFKIYPENMGNSVLWDGDFCNMSPGDFHVIEYSAYEKLQAQLDEAAKCLIKINAEAAMSTPSWSAEEARITLVSLRKEK